MVTCSISLGFLSGPQPEASWTRPRGGLTSWPCSRPFLCVRCEMCAANHLTSSPCALIGARWVPCPSKMATEPHIPKGTQGHRTQGRRCSAKGSLLAGAPVDGPSSGSHPLVYNKHCQVLVRVDFWVCPGRFWFIGSGLGIRDLNFWQSTQGYSTAGEASSEAPPSQVSSVLSVQ